MVNRAGGPVQKGDREAYMQQSRVDARKQEEDREAYRQQQAELNYARQEAWNKGYWNRVRNTEYVKWIYMK